MFSGFLKQSTATTILLGPFVDETDGYTDETALAIAQADVRLSKNAGNMAQKNESTSCTHDELGMYSCPIDATDTNTLGILTVVVHESGARTVKQEYAIVPANVWDSLFSTDKLQVDVTQIGGTTAPETSGKLHVYDDEGNTVANEAKQDIIDTNLDSTLADTAELQTDWANGGRLDLLIDAIKAKTDNLPGSVPKNVAMSNFVFVMVLSSDHVTPATGKTITAQISKDGGAFASCTNSASEIANGFYKINLTQTEMNADTVALKFTETDCDQRMIVMRTDS